jgi:hypothetical protein
MKNEKFPPAHPNQRKAAKSQSPPTHPPTRIKRKGTETQRRGEFICTITRGYEQGGTDTPPLDVIPTEGAKRRSGGIYGGGWADPASRDGESRWEFLFPNTRWGGWADGYICVHLCDLRFLRGWVGGYRMRYTLWPLTTTQR